MATKHGHAAPAHRRRSIPCITIPFRAFFCKGIMSRTDGFVYNISEKHISHLYEQIGLHNATHPPLREQSKRPGIKKGRGQMLFRKANGRALCLTKETKREKRKRPQKSSARERRSDAFTTELGICGCRRSCLRQRKRSRSRPRRSRPCSRRSRSWRRCCRPPTHRSRTLR